MKNSAETKTRSGDEGSSSLKSGTSGFSLFSIDEHRLSVGLLVLLLLAGAGYGIWVLMLPFLPASSITTTISRKTLAEDHVKSKQWDEAIPIYREMLKDDPDNGFAMQRLARIREVQLFEKWRQLKKVGETTGNSNAANDILKEESLFFESAIERWRSLRDNARYQRRAYERLATLHSYRSSQLNAPEEIDNAVEVLKEMFDNGLSTVEGIDSTDQFKRLESHPDFKRLVRDEKRNSNFRLPEFLKPNQN